MTNNSLLNRPIILSILLFLFSFVFCIIASFNNYSIYVQTVIISFTIALILGLYQEKLNITFDKIKKIKVSVYYSAIYIILLIPIGTFLSCVGAKHLIFPFVTALIFIGIYLTFGIALYLGLLLGCEISKSDETKTIKKFKLIHFLLIVFFIVLTLFTAKFGKIVVDALTVPIFKQMGYVRRNANSVKIEKQHFEDKNLNVNKLIISKNDNTAYNIPINTPTELDFKSKQQVLDIRKKYAAMSHVFIPANYTPSNEVFGQIQENKPWWGLNGMMYRGAGQNSIEGLSEESRAINNPLVLFIVDPNFWFVDLNLKGNEETYPKPISITFQPSKKTIYVVYDVTNFDKAMNTYLNNNANESFDDSNEYTLNGLNARDFGYNYAYAYSSQNISYDNPNNNLSTNVQQLHDFLHTGGSCGYPGGCNNHSPAQPFLNFKNLALPAQIGIKLWKKIPANKKAPADIYFIITLQ